MVVGTSVIEVLPHPAALQFAADAFSGDRLAAERALEEPARQRMLGRARATVPSVHNVLAGVECGPVDQPFVPPLKDLPVAVQFADVEAIVEYPRKRRPIESRMAVAEDMPLTFELVGQAFECVASRGV